MTGHKPAPLAAMRRAGETALSRPADVHRHRVCLLVLRKDHRRDGTTFGFTRAAVALRADGRQPGVLLATCSVPTAAAGLAETYR